MLLQKAPKNGWAFVFLSNESDEPVYFDNLAVTHEHSRIAEENHYYPFGLKIAGISSRAVNKLANKFNYQGDFAEHEEETGWDEFYLRMYDPQIGRWNGADPYDIHASPYIGMGNDPINRIDPLGGFDWFENEKTGEMKYFEGKHEWDFIAGWKYAFAEGPVYDPELGQVWGDRYGKLVAQELGNVTVHSGFLGEIIRRGGTLGTPPEMSTISAGPAIQPPSELQRRAQRGMNTFRVLNPAVYVTEQIVGDVINDAYITAQTMGSGLGGYSKSEVTDVWGNQVGYNKRMSAGINTLTLPTMFANPEGRIASSLSEVGIEEGVTLYRNFGWNELKAIKGGGGKFSIHPNQFQGKQFWVGESGMNMWTNSSFAKPFTAKVTAPKSFVTPGSKNYIFMETDMMIDGFPGGTVLPENLQRFNSAMKIEWIRY